MNYEIGMTKNALQCHCETVPTAKQSPTGSPHSLRSLAMTYIRIFFILLFTYSFIPKIYAVQSISVSPSILPLTLTPGKTVTHTLTLSNSSQTPLPVAITVDSFESTDEDGGYVTGSFQSPLVEWITTSPDNLIIDPHTSRNITVTIHVPSSVAVGGYYAMIFITPVVPVSSGVSRVIPKIGIPVFASLGVDETLHSAVIETYTLSPTILSRGPLNMTIRVKNIGLSHFTAKPYINMINYITKNHIRESLPEKVILPGSIRKWEQAVFTDIPCGLYKAELAVSTGGGNWAREEKTILVFPYQVFTLSIVVLLLLSMILLKRRNLRKALKALFR